MWPKTSLGSRSHSEVDGVLTVNEPRRDSLATKMWPVTPASFLDLFQSMHLFLILYTESLDVFGRNALRNMRAGAMLLHPASRLKPRVIFTVSSRVAYATHTFAMNRNAVSPCRLASILQAPSQRDRASSTLSHVQKTLQTAANQEAL